MEKNSKKVVLPMFKFGNSAVTASRLGFGCWAIGGHGWGNVNDEASTNAVRYALEHGITLFDTADVYGFGHSEEILAEALGDQRKNLVISTKFGVRWDGQNKTWRDISPAYMREALEGSLRRLKIESVPLYYIHWPDGVTVLETIIEALAQEQKKGKIQIIGLSNFSAKDIESASQIAPLGAVQTQYNLLDQERTREVLPICQRLNIPIITWGSLADGLLTGKYDRFSSFDPTDHRQRNPNFQGEKFQENLVKVKKYSAIAQDIGLTPGQLALRWILETKGVGAALFGAKTKEQVRENLAIFNIEFNEDILQRIAAVGSD